MFARLCNLKDFCSLKNLVIVICTFLTCFLTFTVVYKFVITRPTSSTQEHATFNFESFPDVLICVEPAINLTISTRYGYNTPWSYWLGRNSTWDAFGDFIGWNGAEGQGGNNSTQILEELLNVNLKDEGLVSKASYLLWNRAYELKTPVSVFRMMMYPFGRCQLVRPTEFPNTISMSLAMNTTNILKLSDEVAEKRMNVLLMDPVNSPLIFPITFQMRGTPIKLKIKEKRWHSYLVKVSQSRNVEGNPQFDCKDYSVDDTYGDCIKEEFQRRFIEILNCTPPWIPSSQMCNKRLTPKKEDADKLNELLFHEQYKSKL